jgi:hypothetical protein
MPSPSPETATKNGLCVGFRLVPLGTGPVGTVLLSQHLGTEASILGSESLKHSHLENHRVMVVKLVSSLGFFYSLGFMDVYGTF